MKVIIEDDEGRKTVVPLPGGEITIGRQDGNTIRLTERNVSRRHARLSTEDGSVLIEDLGSVNGVRVNGERISRRTKIKEGDLVEIGDYDLGIEGKFEAAQAATAPPRPAPSAPAPAQSAPARSAAQLSPADTARKAAVPPPHAPGRVAPAAGAASKARVPEIAKPSPAGRPQARAPEKKRSFALLAGLAAAAVVVAGAFFTAQRKARPAEAGETAVKQGDALFRQHQYRAAIAKYQLAGESAASKRTKAASEARAEDAYAALKEALAAGDGDKAKALFDECSSEPTYFCQKAVELGDAVKGAYTKSHLAAASAARTAGELETCRREAGAVLAFDPGSAQAQALGSQCGSQQAEKAASPGPGNEEREARAAKLASDCTSKLTGSAKDFQGAVKAAQAALAQEPSARSTLGASYRCLGYGLAYLGDRGNAAKWLEKYLPLCGSDCAQVRQFLGK